MIIIEIDDYYHSESKNSQLTQKVEPYSQKNDANTHKSHGNQEFSQIRRPIGNDRTQQKIPSSGRIEWLSFRREILSWQNLPERLRRHRPPIGKAYSQIKKFSNQKLTINICRSSPMRQTGRPADLPTILHSGWGSKQGQQRRNWKTRYMVLLSNGFLRYFEDKSSFEECGHVDISRQSVAF
jgi:hypothetical protein